MIVYRWEHKIIGCGPYDCRGIENYIAKSTLKKLYHVACIFNHVSCNHPSIFMELENSLGPLNYIEKYLQILRDFVNASSADEKRNYIFGFTNYQQMINWFNEKDIELMVECGFVYKRYEISDDADNYMLTKTQVLFKRDACLNTSIENYSYRIK